MYFHNHWMDLKEFEVQWTLWSLKKETAAKEDSLHLHRVRCVSTTSRIFKVKVTSRKLCLVRFKIWMWNSSKNQWTSLRFGNFLFLFGTRSDGYDPVLKRFDGNMKVWIDLTPIPRKAAVASTAGLVGNEHILSVAGMFVTMHSKQIRDGSKFDSSVYRYSICRDKWERVQRFPSRVAYAASCSRQGTLYVAGGVVPKVNRPSLASAEVRTWNRLYAFDNTGGTLVI